MDRPCGASRKRAGPSPAVAPRTHAKIKGVLLSRDVDCYASISSGNMIPVTGARAKMLCFCTTCGRWCAEREGRRGKYRKLAFGGGMKHWAASVVAILLASFPGVVSAQVDCNAVLAGPARTDCYIGLSRVYQGQSDVAAGNARVQSDAARYQQVTGTRSRSKTSKHRRNRAATVGPE